MAGQMCWISAFGTNGQKILHLQIAPNQPWRPYTAFPQIALPDYREPGGSKGWATYQKLIRAGWKLVASADVMQTLSMDTDTEVA